MTEPVEAGEGGPRRREVLVSSSMELDALGRRTCRTVLVVEDLEEWSGSLRMETGVGSWYAGRGSESGGVFIVEGTGPSSYVGSFELLPSLVSLVVVSWLLSRVLSPRLVRRLLDAVRRSLVLRRVTCCRRLGQDKPSSCERQIRDNRRRKRAGRETMRDTVEGTMQYPVPARNSPLIFFFSFSHSSPVPLRSTDSGWWAILV